MSPSKILLVDDSAVVLMTERMILEQAIACDLITASNGVEAIELANKERPDLILLDVVMPEMDGFEVLQRLRADPETEAIPIIMVTTRSELESMETAFASGCNDFVTKPIDGAELLAKIESVLG